MALSIAPGDRIRVTARIVNNGPTYTYKYGCSIGMSTNYPTSDEGNWHPQVGGPVQYDDGPEEYIDVPLARIGEAGDTADVSRDFLISASITPAELAELLDTYVTVKDADLNTLSWDIDVNELDPLYPSATITFISVEKI